MKVINFSDEFLKLVKLNNGSYKKAVHKILNFDRNRENLTEEEKEILKNVYSRLISMIDSEIEFVNSEIERTKNLELGFKKKKNKRVKVR